LTRANVVQIGFAVLLFGAVGFGFFRLIGFESESAGIWAEALLIMIVFGWTGTYLLRVLTGKMTFMEQRKRYREDYEKIINAELQSKFDSMSEDDQAILTREVEDE